MTKVIPRLQPRKKRQNLSGNATLVIVEGQTEEKYFSDLSNYHRNLSTFVLRGQGTDPVSLVEYAAKLYNTGRQGNSRQQRASAKCFPAKLFDKIFIVFDEDEKPEQRKKALDAIKSFNKRNKSVKMTACDSRPNFELWLLLHHEPLQPRPYGIADIQKKLCKHMQNYSKAMDGLFTVFHGKTETAIKNSESLRNNKDRDEGDCFTNVDVLVKYCQQN